MSQDWKKRYTFRLTDNDKEIHDFIEHSKETDSETIRKLLKFALVQINAERRRQQENKFQLKLMQELEALKEQQTKNHLEIMDKLDKGITIGQKAEDPFDIEKEKVERSVENSIASMLSSFSMDD